jgi:hypothetical protein
MKKIKFPIEFKCTWEKGQKSGKAYMQCADSTVDVLDDDDNRIGSISAVYGGGIQIIHDGETWIMDMRDLWGAFTKAVK